MDQPAFPWRLLGTLLVEEKLLDETALERALAEQRRTGRLLGEILVTQGALTEAALTRVLARQHGVEFKVPVAEPSPGAGAVAAPAAAAPAETPRAEAPARPQQAQSWKPLGKLLLEKGLVSEEGLTEALVEKRKHQNRRLGEILIERGHLTGAALVSALAEQHGLNGAGANAGTVDVRLVPVAPGQPTYQVSAVIFGPTDGPRKVLYEGPNILEAMDFACDFVDRASPVSVQIERRESSQVEIVWTYSRERGAAQAGTAEKRVEILAFDPTRPDART